jgi:hypothetical protein
MILLDSSDCILLIKGRDWCFSDEIQLSLNFLVGVRAVLPGFEIREILFSYQLILWMVKVVL